MLLLLSIFVTHTALVFYFLFPFEHLTRCANIALEVNQWVISPPVFSSAMTNTAQTLSICVCPVFFFFFFSVYLSSIDTIFCVPHSLSAADQSSLVIQTLWSLRSQSKRERKSAGFIIGGSSPMITTLSQNTEHWALNLFLAYKFR